MGAKTGLAVPPWPLLIEPDEDDPIATKPAGRRVFRYLPLAPTTPEPHARPKTRAECVSDVRPCPFVGCRHHLALDVGENGKLNFVGLDIETMAETCSLDVADAGGVTLEAVGDLLGVSRERVRQIEEQALRKLRARDRIRGVLRDELDGRNGREPTGWEEMAER